MMNTTKTPQPRTQDGHDTAEYDLVLVGGGLQSALIALACLARDPSRRIAVVERAAAFGGNHTWCLHDGDAPERARGWLSPLLAHRWTGYDVLFPGRARTLEGSYAAVTSARLHSVLSSALADAPGCQAYLGRTATEMGDRGVCLDDGTRLAAALVVDARGPQPDAGAGRCGYQKFLGLELVLDAPHGRTRPMLMDATIPQGDGFRFMYVLPLGPRRLLVEDTTFSRSPELDHAAAARAVREYTAQHFGSIAEVRRGETGVLPMPFADGGQRPVIGGGAPLVAGYRGGFFHPGTGYSMPAAIALAQCIADAPSPGELRPALDVLWRNHRTQARYAEQLNWLLFHCFAPQDMWNVFARFYGLPQPLIHRFYGLQTTLLDRARILVGRPPRGVSLRAAIAATAATAPTYSTIEPGAPRAGTSGGTA